MLTRDQYREGRKDSRTLFMFVVGLGVLIFGAVAVLSYLQHRPRDLAQAERWDVPGPACPELTREAFGALPIKVKSRVQFDRLAIGRAFGHIECEDVPYRGWRTSMRYPACHLTGPAVLSVAVDGRETFFNPGFGNRVTLALPDGKLKCMIGGDFGGF